MFSKQLKQKNNMNREVIIKKTEEFVRNYLSGAETGHNWYHIDRVRNNALFIQSKERSGDRFIIELCSLLHDTGDHKIDPDADGPAIVEKFCAGMELDSKTTDRVKSVISGISFRDSYTKMNNGSIEFRIVQDADRLDAIGAIGIARAFNYGGSVNNEMHVPGQEPSVFRLKEEYISSKSSTINHFYEKLLKLKDMMNTKTGREMAVERHQFMELFLERFFNEWRVKIDS